ncbi:hypothetical protein D3C87_1820730 [compost metagenome]
MRGLDGLWEKRFGFHETVEVARRTSLRAGFMAPLLSAHNVAIGRRTAQHDALRR